MEGFLILGILLFGGLLLAACSIVPIAYLLASLIGRGTAWLTSVFRRVFIYGALLALIMTGCGASGTSLNDIQSMRQAERTPDVEIASLISGEVAVTGVILSGSDLLRAPHTGDEAVYYRYLIQARDGDSWTTVESRSERVEDFVIEDATGRIQVVPAGASINASVKHRHVEGQMRYTEYRLDPGDTVYMMGYAAESDGAYTIGFRERGDYRPRISSFETSADFYRENKAGQSRFLMAFGVGCLLLVAFFLFGRLLIHGTAFYLVGATAVVVGVMGVQGIWMLKSDIELAHRSATHVVTQGEQAIQQILRHHTIEVSAVNDIGSLHEPPFDRLSDAERQRVAGVRFRMAQAVAHTDPSRMPFIDRAVARTMGLSPLPTIQLPRDEEERLTTLASVAPPRPNRVTATLALLLGGAGIYFGTYWGFRRIRRRRIIENVPPSSASGVAYGLTEVKGTVEAIDSNLLISPISRTPCVCYTHVVMHSENRKSDGKRRTQEGNDFWCRDESGRIRVSPKNAEIYGTQQTKKKIGKEMHVETVITPGETLYVMGTAQIDPQTHDALFIGADTTDDAVPFVVSTQSADALKQQFSVAGVGLLSVGVWATTVAGIWGTSLVLPVGPSMYLTIAGLSMAYLFVVMGIIYYNDFVFLKQRAMRNASNIEAALKKRYDLIQRLATTVQEYLGYEQSIQETLAQLRTVQTADVTQEAALETGTEARKKLQLRVEDTPALKGHALTGELMEALVHVENDVAFMRTGYNDAVERYNNRIYQVPEVLVAKAFRFKSLSWL